MSAGKPREWRFYTDDMVRFANKVLTNVAGLDQTSFVESELTYDATLRNLELLGDLAQARGDPAVSRRLSPAHRRSSLATSNTRSHSSTNACWHGGDHRLLDLVFGLRQVAQLCRLEECSTGVSMPWRT
ncbi:MAG: nucleotidyltransferase [Trueperaceae bacterium]|nr:MAG: nucleotidyltransferase [Trueperaceae bacterium]